MESIVLVNSQSIPSVPNKTNFANRESIRAYGHFIDNIGIKITNAPSLNNYEDFLGG